MLRVVPNPEFTANVRLTVPGSDEPAVLRVTFRHKNRQAMADWKEAHRDKTVVEALGSVIVAWEGVSNEQGEPVAYSRDSLAIVLANYHTAGEEFLAAYLRELTESRIKN